MSAQRAAQLVEAGVWLQATGDHEGARRLFEQALKLDPDNARARQLLGLPGGATQPAAPPTPPPSIPTGTIPYVAGAVPTGTLIYGPGPTPPALDPEPGTPTELSPVPRSERATLIVANPWAVPPGLTPHRAELPFAPPGLVSRPAAPEHSPPPPPAAVDTRTPLLERVEATLAMPDAPLEVAAGDGQGAFVEAEIDWGSETGPQPDAEAEKDDRDPDIISPITPLKPPDRPGQPRMTSAWDSGTDPGFLIAASAGRDRRFKEPMDLVTENHTPLPLKLPTASQALRLKDEVATLVRGAKDLQELDDHSGALDLLKKAVDLDPMNTEAQKLKDKSERTLEAIYESKLGRMDAVPKVAMKSDEIIWLNLDHRAGFVLAQIDGAVSYDDLFAICGMSRLDTARILAQLKDEGVIRS